MKSSTSPRSWHLAIVLLACLGLAAPAWAEIRVTILEPSFLQPVFGAGKMVVKVESEEPILRVEFFFDGKRLGEDRQAPYELPFDAGQENVGHRFRAVAHATSGATGEEAIETPKIQVDEVVDFELQQLYVTVTDSGSRLLNLDRADFTVLDDGERQNIVTFEQGEVPLTAILLLDVSESMRGERLQAALAGARTFIEGMRDLDEAMLILFSDQLFRATDFSQDKKSLVKLLDADEVEAVGGTAVNDHLYMALNHLDQRQGRRVVVLLSDGVDVHSVLPMDEVLWRARRSQALIYWIHLSSEPLEAAAPVASAWRNAQGSQKELELLSKAVEESGGRLELLSDLGELKTAYKGILDELREQYVLGYYPSSTRDDGSWHPVKVRVKRSGVDVRTRGGYIDF